MNQFEVTDHYFLPDRGAMRRLLVRSLVVLTALLCLGTAGYAGQVWWARKQADQWLTTHGGSVEGEDNFFSKIQGNTGYRLEFVDYWRKAPWYGLPFTSEPASMPSRWRPRRTLYEILKQATGLDLPNDPSAWEAWFKEHPNLVWDERQERLVEPTIP